jgi:hypothetical protein
MQPSCAGTLIQIYAQAKALNPLPPQPNQAHMSKTAFTSSDLDQPDQRPFLLRMLAKVYHPGGQSKVGVTGQPPGTTAWIAMGGNMLASATFTMPEGTYELDVRYDVFSFEC